MTHRNFQNFDELPDSAFVRLNHLIDTRIIPFSPSTIWRKVQRGQFPAPAKLSDNITAWNVGAVRRWQASMLATQVTLADEEFSNDR
ncbi:MAG: AlpA family transcriptional regulator [Burkholderiales bacterium PBB4]|nr:MAG: AlpA family transcriptional regulator [Burkholderiales bacterium PBB4]